MCKTVLLQATFSDAKRAPSKKKTCYFNARAEGGESGRGAPPLTTKNSYSPIIKNNAKALLLTPATTRAKSRFHPWSTINMSASQNIHFSKIDSSKDWFLKNTISESSRFDIFEESSFCELIIWTFFAKSTFWKSHIFTCLRNLHFQNFACWHVQKSIVW